jgi:ABC-2 type transport system ATP-binding protein
MLEIKNLNKSYGKFRALDNLNLTVEKGEVFGFVGPNGAGKTTSMKIIAGLMPASSGEVYIDGIDVFKDTREAKARLGYMPDFFGVYDDLKVSEYMDFYASIYGIEGKARDKICGELLELVNLPDKRDFYVDSLSRGMKQRLCLARALIHNPKLLILDEPASGMDPKARVEMKDILRTLKDMGKTVIISSHILPELAEICSTIGIIDKGKMLIKGTVTEIMDRLYSGKRIKIRLNREHEKAVRCLKEFPNISGISTGENLISANFSGSEDDLHMVLKSLVQRDVPVVEFSMMEGNLEDLFMKVIGGGNSGEN